jgi:DNA-binding NtrC family response regulator
VLVVDDDEDVAESIHDALTLFGCRVVKTRDLASAQHAFASDDFDVVICDWNLGEESSAGFLRDVARQRPYVERILLTGSPRHEWELLLAAGVVQRSMAKPCELQRLAAAVLELSRPQSETPSTRSAFAHRR